MNANYLKHVKILIIGLELVLNQSILWSEACEVHSIYVKFCIQYRPKFVLELCKLKSLYDKVFKK